MHWLSSVLLCHDEPHSPLLRHPHHTQSSVMSACVADQVCKCVQLHQHEAMMTEPQSLVHTTTTEVYSVEQNVVCVVSQEAVKEDEDAALNQQLYHLLSDNVTKQIIIS